MRKAASLSNYGVKAIQLREKKMQTGELLQLAKDIKQEVNLQKTKIIVNDRIDIVILAELSGVHSVTNGIPAEYIHKFCRGKISGKSVHSLKEALQAEKDGFDYVLFGPVFRTPAKVKYGKPQGLKKLNEVCVKINIPVIAVGGINPARAKKCIDAGAYGVAAIRDLFNTSNIKAKLSEYKIALEGL